VTHQARPAPAPLPPQAARYLSDVLRELETHYGVTFVHSSALETNRQVSLDLDLRAASLEKVLQQLLEPLELRYKKVSQKSYVISPAKPRPASPQRSANEPDGGPRSAGSGMAAAFTVQGKVTDEAGGALPGVSVLLKGTTTGTATGSDGTYSLTLPGGAETGTLVFSFIGYLTREVPVGNRARVDVTMPPDVKALGEVVVVGYGTQSRRNVTGSVARVDMKQMENLPNTNVAQALRGRVAGVQFTDNGRPGQGGSILVRGQRSISAGNNPLIILDGIFFEGSLNDINPGDVASMEVLKDASATAIYGARAANGVILITSKRGTTDKPTIRFSTYYGVSGWSYQPKLLSPDRYIEKTLDWRRQSGLDADPDKITNYLTPTEARNYAEGRPIDPWKVASQPAGIANFDLSVSGVAGRTNYFISGNYNNDRGLIYGDKASRTGVRVNLDNQVTGWLEIGVNAQYAERDLSGNNADLGVTYWTSPFNDVWLDDAGTDPAPRGNEDGLVGGILFGALLNQNQEIQRNLFANFYGILEVPFLKGLSYRVNYSPNLRWYNNNNFSPIYGRNGRNDQGSASRQFDFNRTWVLENILTYARQFGPDHALDLTLLYGRNQAFNQTLLATGNDFSGASDANGWDNLGLARVQVTNTSASRVDAISSMARLNYRFKDRYLLTLTARRDGNSVFGANNKFGTFPSAAVAWIASEESFLKSVAALSLLKLRASYGAVGNQAIAPYQSQTRLGQAQYVYGDGGVTASGLFPQNLANPNLSWETTTTANLALDFEVLRGRIGGTVEYYNMDTRDLLLTRQLPGPTGFANILTNVGATNNRGVEVTLNTVNLRRGDLEWNTSLAFSTNKNKIVHLYRSDANGDGAEDNDLNNRWFIGQPIEVAFDYRLDGVYQEEDPIPVGQKAGFFRMQDANGDGAITPDDRVVLGTRQPRFRWNVSNNLRYGPFNLMVNVNALQGFMGVNHLLALDQSGGAGNYPGRAANFLDAGWWTPENRSNTRSSLVYTNPFGHTYYQRRDFVRLQEVALSYDFPGGLIDALKMSALRVYVSGRNLYTFTDWLGSDPEIGADGRGGFPLPRTVSAGLNVSF
jgi:TonB-linked SusC/RagA family outer membrane protein